MPFETVPDQMFSREWEELNECDDFECSEDCDERCDQCELRRGCFPDMSEYGSELFSLGEILARAQGGTRG